MTQPAPPLPRRDFLVTATASLGGVALGAGLWGLGRSTMTAYPAPEVLQVDLTGLPEGAELTVKFQGKPVVIRHRTPAEIAAAEATPVSDLPDTLARNENLPLDAPATDQNRRATPDGRFYVSSRVCTHLGCIVLGDGAGDFGGYFCPCHGGQFDTAGRIRKGPPPRNLPIPALEWQEPGILTLLPAPRITPGRLEGLIRS